MKFGMPTLVECKDIFDCCDVAEKYGLDFVEINMSFPQYQPSSLKPDTLLKITRIKMALLDWQKRYCWMITLMQTVTPKIFLPMSMAKCVSIGKNRSCLGNSICKA